VTEALNLSFLDALTEALKGAAPFMTVSLDDASLAQVGELHWGATMLVGILDTELAHRDHTVDFAGQG